MVGIEQAIGELGKKVTCFILQEHAVSSDYFSAGS